MRNLARKFARAFFSLCVLCIPNAEAQTERADAAAAPEPIVEYKSIPGKTQNGILTVNADIPEVEIYLDGILAGKTPLTQTLAPGFYTLGLQKDGYTPRIYRLTVEENIHATLNFPMSALSGILAVENIPADTAITVTDVTSGKTLLQTTASERANLSLPVGRVRVRLTAFGFAEKTGTATVRRGETARFDGSMEAEAFRLNSFEVENSVFNPRNPGGLGVCRFRFSATAGGSAVVSVKRAEAAQTDGGSDALAEISFPQIASSETEGVWDGRAQNGEILPDGVYTLELTATAKNGAASETMRATAEISLQKRYPVTSGATGIGKIGNVYNAERLPAKSMTASVNAGLSPDCFSLKGGAGGGIFSALEAGIAGGFSYTEEKVLFEADGGVKAGASFTPFADNTALHFAGGVSYAGAFPVKKVDGEIRRVFFDRKGLSVFAAVSAVSASGMFSGGLSGAFILGEADGEIRFGGGTGKSGQGGAFVSLAAKNTDISAWGALLLESAEDGENTADTSCTAGILFRFFLPTAPVNVTAEAAGKFGDGNPLFMLKLGAGIAHDFL